MWTKVKNTRVRVRGFTVDNAWERTAKGSFDSSATGVRSTYGGTRSSSNGGDDAESEDEGTWQRAVDKDGKEYFFNTRTRRTTWTAKAGTETDDDDDDDDGVDQEVDEDAIERDGTDGPEEWKRFVDNDGKEYFLNTKTGKTTWVMNGESKAGDQGSKVADPDIIENEGADSLGGEWKRFVDKHGKEYFFNTETRRTTWTRPDVDDPSSSGAMV